MGKIVLLDEHLANKIAAGEVVERPASIVKELVENALDAKSTRIEIEVEEGGISKVKVTDNGTGISGEDCELAFQRHATSKISNEQDLFHIQTLGFRGEALPSIASVSQLELKTSTGDRPGRRLVLQGGHLIHSSATDSRQGTEVTVTNLFFNTPARLKHLKTVNTELGNISDVVNKLALAHPEVSFTFTHNGKPMLQTYGKGDLAQVLASIYGYQTARQSLPLKAESQDFILSGRLVKPEITRAGRQYVYIFINGRYIRHYGIFNAVVSGYHTLLPIGRYPIAVIHIKMDPALVDINVHPAKLEARLSKEKELLELVEAGIRQAFHRLSLIPEMSPKSQKKQRPVTEQQSFSFTETPRQPEKAIEVQGEPQPTRKQRQDLGGADEVSSQQSFEVQYQDVRNQVIKNAEEKSPFIAAPIDYNEAKIYPEKNSEVDNSSETWEAPEVKETPLDSPPNEQRESEERLPPLYPIGQMHGTYILAQNERGLYLIDQHAAQERIKYEYFREKMCEVTNEVQELLVPMTFELTQTEFTLIQEYQDFLEQIGLFFEPFGNHSVIIRSHPYWFPKGEEKETIEEIIEQLITTQKISILKLREKLAIMMSCKKSIKANRHLRSDEINALLDTLRQAQDPFTCPHGRPVIIHFSTYDMEKLFKRVM